MKPNHILMLLAFLSKLVVAQTLKPSIGLSSIPAAGSTICAIPVYTGNFSASGYQAGDTIPHFKLYDAAGNATDVLTVLQTGKPLLLIGGSYTCPVFRQKMAKINQVKNTYGSQINIFIIYVVEAHPKSPDPSPYSGTVWTTSENQTEGILYLQATTYGARTQAMNDMFANPSYTTTVPVLLDGPCNEWWMSFGPAPNNAYLIKPDGVIYKKHAWFDKNPDNIVNDINALLQTLGLNEQSAAGLGVFPNPSSGTVTMDLSSLQGPANVRIVNSEGIETRQFTVEGGTEVTLDVNDLPRGIYLYQISASAKFIYGKLILR